MELSSISIEALSELTRLRRDLHQMPEVSLKELNTSQYIKDYLASLKIKFKTSHTGVYCDIQGDNTKKTVAFRCDFDALPIGEKTEVSYKSTNGCMHACGHDGHTAILLYLAKILSEKKPPFNVRLIYQYGEEGEGGALRMIDDGVLNGVNEIYALHVDPSLKKGSLSTIEGAMFAGAVEFDIEFFGKAAHCAEPQNGIDVIKAMTHFLTSASALNQKYKNNTLFHVGKISAGLARNIVSDSGIMHCSLRYFDDFAKEDIMMNVARLLNETKNEFKTDYFVHVECELSPVINSQAAVNKVRGLIEGIEECTPRYTAEDFGQYLKHVGGCMLWLGIKDEQFFSPLHTNTFGFDENALMYGLEFYLRLLQF